MKGKDKELTAQKSKDLVHVAERAHKDAARKAEAADEASRRAKSALKQAKKEYQGREQGGA